MGLFCWINIFEEMGILFFDHWLGSGAIDFKVITLVIPHDPFCHLGTGGVVGTYEKSLFLCHC